MFWKPISLLLAKGWSWSPRLASLMCPDSSLTGFSKPCPYYLLRSFIKNSSIIPFKRSTYFCQNSYMTFIWTIRIKFKSNSLLREFHKQIINFAPTPKYFLLYSQQCACIYQDLPPFINVLVKICLLSLASS